MSRTTAPRTGGKAAPKNHSPPRDATGADAAGADAGSGTDALRKRHRGSEHAGGGGGGSDDTRGKAGPTHWDALRDTLEHKTLLQTLARGFKPLHANVSDAARQELNLPKRALLHACSYALSVPAALSGYPGVMSALGIADRGIGWVYDRTHGAVSRLEAEGERVAHDSGKAFDATVSGAPAKAELTPVTAAKANGLKALLYQLTAVVVYLSLTAARAVVAAVTNPRATADAIVRGVGNVVSIEQWKLRAKAFTTAVRHLWASRLASHKGDVAQPGGPMRSALTEFASAVFLLFTPWRPVPNPVQHAQ